MKQRHKSAIGFVAPASRQRFSFSATLGKTAGKMSALQAEGQFHG